jgi:hypothetical protein
VAGWLVRSTDCSTRSATLRGEPTSRTISARQPGSCSAAPAVLFGACFAYLQFTQQQRAAQDLLISNQVSKGFGQLIVDKMATRLGGICALEGVMNNSGQYRKPVLEALCAFVGISIGVRLPRVGSGPLARHTVSGPIANDNVYLLCYTIF